MKQTEKLLEIIDSVGNDYNYDDDSYYEQRKINIFVSKEIYKKIIRRLIIRLMYDSKNDYCIELYGIDLSITLGYYFEANISILKKENYEEINLKNNNVFIFSQNSKKSKEVKEIISYLKDSHRHFLITDKENTGFLYFL